MEIVRSQRESTHAAASTTSAKLSFYRSVPALEVRLEDFELYGIDRLRVLQGILDGLSRGKMPEEMEKLVLLLSPSPPRDELRKWFLSMETSLFRYRFRLESPEGHSCPNFSYPIRLLVMQNSRMPFSTYRKIFFIALQTVKEKLNQVACSIGQPLNADTLFFKAPFEEVPELFVGRKVFLQKGFAYVAMHQVVSLVATQFRSNLSKCLVLTNSLQISSTPELKLMKCGSNGLNAC
ncbi:hypothetical protein ZIOFF_039801 [Zingiber officinale]|uniref:Uncharacterized protein n=1 Tax=Zingiber officinale TaxID=94328 RepID=A0A8J5G952_ZINOF|nr:hypothetical protein ZIOFF_039801 [Zingiber officinale]